MQSAKDDRPLTAEEFSRLPEDGLRHELRAGLLVSEPIPFPRHAQLQARLAHTLSAFVEANALGVVLTDGGFLLSLAPDTVRGPDVAFVLRDRYDAGEASRGFFRGAPDLAIEILSPSNRPAEIHAKVADYLAAGARLVWVVDPGRRAVTVHRSLLDRRCLEVGDALSGEEVLPGFALDLESFFA